MNINVRQAIFVNARDEEVMFSFMLRRQRLFCVQ